MSSYSYRNFECDVERLYAHWLELKHKKTPCELLENFYCLFIDGTEYFNPEILAVLHRIVLSNWAKQEFSNIFNRCCYILINHWWLQAEFQEVSSELVELLMMSASVPATSIATRQLRELVKQFTRTEQFAGLQRRVQATGDRSRSAQDEKSERIGHLIHRYPSLYPYCLLDWDSSDTGQQAVNYLQAQKEKEFEADLLRYTRDWILRSHNPHRASPVPVHNPTLLSASQLEAAIYQFAGKVEGNRSYRDSARQFLLEVGQVRSYQEIKQQMYEYLTAAIDHSCNPKYGKHHFNHWLNDHLKETLSRSDQVKPNGFLLVQTCGQLLEGLVASPHRPNHVRFIDLINNLGATFTIGLLLKIVLLCSTVRSNLEAMKSQLSRRFALMFKHYESHARSGNEWLVECLDNLTIASTIHFGQEDYSKWANLLQR
jgi:hypothetical protein